MRGFNNAGSRSRSSVTYRAASTGYHPLYLYFFLRKRKRKRSRPRYFVNPYRVLKSLFPKFMETVAGLAGQVLGNIIGDFNGAYLGDEIARRAYRNMPPIRRNIRSRIRQRYATANRNARALARAGSRLYNRRGRNTTVTQQYDVKTQYLKKTMPKYKKKQWKKFVNKVNAVGIKNAGLKTVIFNTKIQNNSPPGGQNAFCIALYGINGTDSGQAAGYGDVQKIFVNEPAIKSSGGTPNVAENGVLNFGSAVLDLTLRNTGLVDAEVDIYYGYHWKDATLENPRNGANTRNLIEDFNNGSFNQSIAVGNPTLDLSVRGCTPFELSTCISASGFKILRKQKILMTPGKSVFIQHRDPKNHRADYVNINKGGYGKKRLTYEVLVVHKPSVDASDELVSTIVCGVTRKYSYTILDWNQDENARLA